MGVRSHPNEQELRRLISELLDGRISPGDHARLESMLEHDAGARQLYMQLVDLETELPCLFADSAGSAKANPILDLVKERKLLHINFARPGWAIFGAAACLMILATIAAVRWFQPSARNLDPDKIAATSWSQDFESGKLSGWFGKIATNNLPAGSRFGITTTSRTFGNDPTIYHIIQLPENWRDGLFPLTNSSTLHFNYRLEKTGLLNVFMHTIRPGTTEGYEMFGLRSSLLPGRTQVWQTASIPFSRFVRKIITPPDNTLQFAGGPPEPGERVCTLSFSSPEDLRLVIDRVWVTPTGPQQEEIQPFPPKSNL